MATPSRPPPPSSSPPPPALTEAQGQSAAASENQDQRRQLPPATASLAYRSPAFPNNSTSSMADPILNQPMNLSSSPAPTAAHDQSAPASEIQLSTSANVDPAPSSASGPKGEEEEEAKLKEELEWLKEMQGWLVVLATIIASVTYSAGINVPGGFWQDDSPAANNITKRHTAGNPVLFDKSQIRYIIFFSANTCAFIESIVAIVLLFRRSSFRSKRRLPFMFEYLLASLFTLAVAYCAGSTRTIAEIIGMASVLVLISLFLFWVLRSLKNPANVEPTNVFVRNQQP